MPFFSNTLHTDKRRDTCERVANAYMNLVFVSYAIRVYTEELMSREFLNFFFSISGVCIGECGFGFKHQCRIVGGRHVVVAFDCISHL